MFRIACFGYLALLTVLAFFASCAPCEAGGFRSSGTVTHASNGRTFFRSDVRHDYNYRGSRSDFFAYGGGYGGYVAQPTPTVVETTTFTGPLTGGASYSPPPPPPDPGFTGSLSALHARLAELERRNYSLGAGYSSGGVGYSTTTYSAAPVLFSATPVYSFGYSPAFFSRGYNYGGYGRGFGGSRHR